MRQRGVLYDVGRAMSARGMNWRPDYTPARARRELEIIRTDLHANAVRICGLDLTRVITAAEDALAIGLDVWLSPELWGATPERTLRYLAEAAVAAEPLRRKWPDRIIFSVGNELTFFMRGIVPGRRFDQRTQLSKLREQIGTGAHTPPLRAFLRAATTAVRREYHGPLSYSALRFEDVDWDLFDVIGLNHYLNTASAATYSDVLEPLLATGKPVSVTEFGFPACEAADAPDMLRIGLNAGPIGVIGQRIPLAGRLIRPRVRTIYPRDEAKQARLLAEQIDLLDQLGVDGAYIMSFSFPLSPYYPDPRHDLDATALALVRSLPHGQRGTTYPDLTWEPKEAFHAVAERYRRLAAQNDPGPDS
jgi:hypothetical protein